jgi:crotonobetainyl-CoA hydratase
VVPVSELAAAADRWAEKIAACAPRAVQAAKDAALRGLGMPLEQALSTRYEPIEAYAGTKDQLEGLAAFTEKRKPVWTGR